MGRHHLDEGPAGPRVDYLEDVVGALQDRIDALHSKVDEAVERVGGELAKATARIHDEFVGDDPQPETSNAPAVVVDKPAEPEPPVADDPTAGGWHPAQP